MRRIARIPRIARMLRKWADLLDPSVSPRSDGGELALKLTLDAEQFTVSMDAIENRLDRVFAKAETAIPLLTAKAKKARLAAK